MNYIEKLIEKELTNLEKELIERKLSSSTKRKETWNKNTGMNWEKDIEPTVKKMKKHKNIDNPYALRQWQVLPKFAKDRKEAAKKAAKSRKK